MKSFVRLWLIGAVILVGLIVEGCTSTKSSSGTSTTGGATAPTAAATAPPTTVPTRQVQGTATTLGAGTFSAGKDVAVGLYNVTPGAGQSGNFMVEGTDSYNEILGSGGVPKVRVKISNGDTITISSLSQVTFTPVTTP